MLEFEQDIALDVGITLGYVFVRYRLALCSLWTPPIQLLYCTRKMCIVIIIIVVVVVLFIFIYF